MPLPRTSILFRPLKRPALRPAGKKVVEAPGTAPGSATLISHNVYRHSRLPDPLNISLSGGQWKGLRGQVEPVSE
jgi:hypothetical protein